MERTYSGLQKAIQRASQAQGGGDGVDILAHSLDVKRKTILNWLREDGTPLGGAAALPDNKVAEAAKKAGGVPALARELGVTPQAVREWVKYGYVPAKRAQEIEIRYGIPRAELVSPKMRSAMGLGGDL